jgi:DNA-binding CsgD family transcriptional regulator
METYVETLDRISRSGEAVFAADGGNRIIHWNKACETLLGKSARAVLGKPCNEVLCGRDSFGNVYCQRNCAVAHQARDTKGDPVHPFELNVESGNGGFKRLSSSLFSIPSYHPALTTLVHVLREKTASETAASPAATPPAREPLAPVMTAEGEAIALTSREKEILTCLGSGLTTAGIAKKLFISPVTVRNHVQSLLHKLDVHSKLAAVVFAYRHQLI